MWSSQIPPLLRKSLTLEVPCSHSMSPSPQGKSHWIQRHSQPSRKQKSHRKGYSSDVSRTVLQRHFWIKAKAELASTSKKVATQKISSTVAENKKLDTFPKATLLMKAVGSLILSLKCCISFESWKNKDPLSITNAYFPTTEVEEWTEKENQNHDL